MTARFEDHILGPDTHTNRPAAASTPKRALYECTTHSKIYYNDGTAWQDWATLAGSAAVPSGGTAGQVLTKNSGTDYDTGWTTPGGGGGGGGAATAAADGKPTAATLPTTPNAKDDEFNDTTGMSGPINGLDAKWSKHNLATAGWSVLDDTKAPGCFMFDLPATAADQAIYQAVPAGDFRATCRTMLANWGDRQMWGLFIVNSAGNGVGVPLDDPAGGGANPVIRNLTSWVQAAGTTSLSAPTNNPWTQGVPVYLSLRKSGSTYYGASWSSDRLLATGALETSFTPTAFTPAYVGFGRMYGGGGVGRVLLDSFRIS